MMPDEMIARVEDMLTRADSYADVAYGYVALVESLRTMITELESAQEVYEHSERTHYDS